MVQESSLSKYSYTLAGKLAKFPTSIQLVNNGFRLEFNQRPSLENLGIAFNKTVRQALTLDYTVSNAREA